MAKRSPRTKVTDADVVNRLVRALAAGSYRQVAAQHAGISVSTFYRWMERGEADVQAGVASPERDVWEAVKKAEADAEVRDLALISQAANSGSWQAAAWKLERKHPDRWGRRERHEHGGIGGGPIRTEQAIDLKKLPPRELRELRELLVKADAGSDN